MLRRANNLPISLVRNNSLDSCQLFPGMDDSRCNYDFGAYRCGMNIGQVEISGQATVLYECVSFTCDRPVRS